MNETEFAQVFRSRLEELFPDARDRRWIFVAPDQLSADLGPLAREEPGELGVVLVESEERARRRPYHRQRLALEWANQRQFALELGARGIAVDYRITARSPADELAAAIADHGPLRMMEAAERELRRELAPLVEDGHLQILEHEGWLTTDEDFELSCAQRKHWRMDAFYRQVRERTGILVEDGGPVGGRWSFDTENRKPWKGDPPAPDPLRFEADAIDREVLELVERRFADHPGQLAADRLPTTADDARRLWRWACTEALPVFGPYEDAMSSESRTLFHTQISALMNLHRILPRTVVDDALELDLPLASREGFVRQVLGWREFVRHVHRRTDGFRALRGESAPVASTFDRGAMPDALGADRPLPDAWWGTPSGLHCLDTVVESVWEEGYSHHITRLMVLSNLATLLDVSPRELTDWFWVAYTDAWDWVVEANVLAMGTFATGDLMTTKPYVSGAAYIHRMSDYCDDCRFHPKKDCPVTPLYWAFLERHRPQLEGNPRLAMPYRTLDRRDPARRRADAEVFERVHAALDAGEQLEP